MEELIDKLKQDLKSLSVVAFFDKYYLNDNQWNFEHVLKYENNELLTAVQEFKEIINEKKSANLAKKSLIDFYREIPDGQGGTDLGLYYLSYLDEACKKVNVKFESLVNQFSSSDLTVINLTFNF